MKNTIFAQFTNLYSLTKTLRFELKPVGKTEEYYREILPKDKKRDKYYHEVMKPILDDLHNSFIVDSLKKVQFSLSDLNNLEEKFFNNGKIDEILEKLRQVVTDSFNNTAKEWKEKFKQKYGLELKGQGGDILTCKEIFGTAKKKGLLEYLYQDDAKELEAIKYFKGFAMYFAGFNENRRNYYSAEEKQTAVAYRIVNQNLLRFLKNRNRFQQIIENFKEIEKFSSYFNLGNYQNILAQKDIDKFNERIVGEINYQVNLYNQKNKTHLPKLDVLYKQVGSPKKENFVFQIKEGREWNELKNLKKAQNKKVELDKKFYSLLPKLKDFYIDFFDNIESFDLTDIYFNKQSINTISNRWFVSWQTLAGLLQIKPDKKTGEAKIPTQISLAQIKGDLEKIKNVKGSGNESYLFVYFKKGKNNKWKEIVNDAENAWQAFVDIWRFEIENNFKEIERLEKELEKRAEKLFHKKNDRGFIKELCDAYLAIERMVKYHRVKENIFTDPNFYEVIDLYLRETELNKYYNAFRNYIAQKPYNEEKIKLNFECGYLLKNGWDKNYDTNGATFFKRGKYFYLGIIHKKIKERDLKKLKTISNKEDVAQKLVYLSQKVDNKNIPRLFIRSKKDSFSPLVREGKLKLSKEILEIYDNKLFLKNKKGYKKYLSKIIQYFQKGLKIHPDFREFKFNWKESDEYEDINEFYNHTSDMCYKIDWEEISWKELLILNQDKKISIFKIKNKDFAERSIGNKNLHTIIFLELLKPENNKYFKLLGHGEIFFRPKTENFKKKRIVTSKNKVLDKGEKAYQKNRYTEDKILFHFSIQINNSFGKMGSDMFNQKINKEYLQRDKTKIIGIDRGEKHLIYISVIDQTGNIIEQKSLNILDIAGREVDFQQKLKKRAGEMMEARKNWDEIGEIKNFKGGYLSYVVYEIYQLIKKYQAIVALEDLNIQFKAKRTAQVEYSLYKKFELALAKKLNHLIFKDEQADEIGVALKGIQLTPKIEAGNIGMFEKAKQWGILFYVNPRYTSITDPITGWRKHKHIANSAPIAKIKEFFVKEGIKIDFDKDRNCFVFSYNHNEQEWKLYAYKGLIRFRYNPTTKTAEEINLYKEFSDLLGKYKDSQNILSTLEQDEKFSWKRLVYLWNLLNQIRNINRGEEGNGNDFLQSPVWSEKIQDFFNSRKVKEYKQKFGVVLPENGDANGAYNIARKGLIILQRQLTNSFNKDLFVSDKDWDEFVVS